MSNDNELLPCPFCGGECSAKFLCSECPLDPIVGSNVYEHEILEWLRGKAVKR